MTALDRWRERMVQEFDYIIVGAGSAGCVLAGNLSKNGRHSVLLLEAGADHSKSFWVRMPMGYGHSVFNPRINWMLHSQPDATMAGRTQFIPRGKAVGGSGSINAMVYMRGSQRDYCEWEALGNPGWGWDEVLASYKRLENHCVRDESLHGLDGPLEVTSRRAFNHPICERFLAAADLLQLPRNDNFNGQTNEGVGYYHHTICARGMRMSAARAYLKDARQRPNFTLLSDAPVQRLVLNGRKVEGVQYTHKGSSHEVKARKEVILCAGAIHSPQVLMVSGIGDPKALKAAGVEPLHSLPAVGQNLQDHVAYDMGFMSRVPTLNRTLSTWYGKVGAGLQWLAFGTGPLTAGTSQAGGFVRSSPERAFPNLQLYFSPLTRDVNSGSPGKMAEADSYSAFVMSVSNTRPKSRGAISLAGPETNVPPNIRFNFMSEPEDMKEMVEGAKLLRRLSVTAALDEIIEKEYLPGLNVARDGELEQDIRERGYSIYHPCGTCAMGPDAARAVVGADLKVHGLEGLRVADASVMPFVTSGNINATAMMIGQRASEILLENS